MPDTADDARKKAEEAAEELKKTIEAMREQTNKAQKLMEQLLADKRSAR